MVSGSGIRRTTPGLQMQYRWLGQGGGTSAGGRRPARPRPPAVPTPKAGHLSQSLCVCTWGPPNQQSWLLTGLAHLLATGVKLPAPQLDGGCSGLRTTPPGPLGVLAAGRLCPKGGRVCPPPHPGGDDPAPGASGQQEPRAPGRQRPPPLVSAPAAAAALLTHGLQYAPHALSPQSPSPLAPLWRAGWLGQGWRRGIQEELGNLSQGAAAAQEPTAWASVFSLPLQEVFLDGSV